ncbi:MAG: trigger factor [Planctomycetota bacterium]
MSPEDLAIDQTTEAEDVHHEPVEDQEQSKEEREKERLKEAIVVQKEEIGPLRLKLTITIPEDLVNERRNDQFQELRKEALIPGFRRGHAPIRLVERRFATDVGEDIKTKLIGSGYLAAVEKEGLEPLGDPLFHVLVKDDRAAEGRSPGSSGSTEKLLALDKALHVLELPKEGPLTYSCEVELRPKFELPELAGIPVKRPKVEVTDRDVDIEIKRMSMMRGTFQPVENGPVEKDDLLYVDWTVSVDGQAVASKENDDLAARDMRIHGIPLKGLAEALVGKSVGDRPTFEAPVPDDHDNLAIRGKSARFEFTVREIKRLQLPPMDQAFVEEQGFENEQELRDYIRDEMTIGVRNMVQDGMRSQVVTYLLENTHLDVPQGLSQRQTDRLISRRIIEMMEAKVPQAEIAKSVDEMRMAAKEQAVRDLKSIFILEKIAEVREIDVTEMELNDAIALIAARSRQRFDRVRDELSKGDGLASLYLRIRDRKALDALIEEGNIEETEGPKIIEST